MTGKTDFIEYNKAIDVSFEAKMYQIRRLLGILTMKEDLLLLIKSYLMQCYPL